MPNVETAALQIGKIIRNARLDKGYTSRSAFVETKPLKGKITGEGLRKIEDGERIPRLETIRTLAKSLGLSSQKVHEIQELALKKQVERMARRAGNASIDFHINGAPMRVTPLPPKRKAEEFTRQVVEDLMKVVDKYGVLPQDLEHFRRHARTKILQHLEEPHAS